MADPATLPDTEGLDLVALLDLLKPIPEPEPISMWPATDAWIWLGLAVLGLLGWGAHILWRRWQANAYRRAALAELEAAGEDPAAIAAVLRRTALAAFPRAEVASLVGPDWLAFLDATSSGGFSTELGTLLTRAPYSPQPGSPDLARLARGWVRGHRREDRT
ncbi:uncharacterized protein DUF4381 [Aliiruegeria haliotis]|uniref:Uncharacterized protein DUF4381 n=1 Tax=Aliiruegeria haliotis TaxID=1280846 RepID=A0A2T0S0H7_9RHOB|nr:DUF4381 domain-containing protein [Aliiruegeria haliotis]PRY26803.1 uncharacterized protein DUF4381 [Aliiruegeria haliotis]